MNQLSWRTLIQSGWLCPAQCPAKVATALPTAARQVSETATEFTNNTHPGPASLAEQVPESLHYSGFVSICGAATLEGRFE